MSYCLNPQCPNPHNLDKENFCLYCGASLWLKNRYKAIQFLGEGGFARTFKAIDRDRLNSFCVIKQFLPQAYNQPAITKASELFEGEAHRLYLLGYHPQIPNLWAYFEGDRYLYLVEDFIEGCNLYQEFKQQGCFTEAKIWDLLKQLLPLLQFIHQAGIIHRDLKPENIIRKPDGTLVLIDFGVSKQLAIQEGETIATVTGTPGYTPLEQMRGRVYPASDLYSLGLTCIRLLVGCWLNADGSDDLYDPLSGSWIWEKKLFDRGIRVGDRLVLILNKLLQEQLTRRYQSASEVLDSIASDRLIPELPEFPTVSIPTISVQLTPESVLNSDKPKTLFSRLPPPPKPPLKMFLASQVGMDYRELGEYLIEEKWQDADRETTNLILKLAGRDRVGWLDCDSIARIPATDLKTLNRLWVIYSQGRFGFGVQKRIWLEILGKEKLNAHSVKAFGDRVGWRRGDRWLYYEQITFARGAAIGHLPLHFTARWGKGFHVFCGWCLRTLNALLCREEL
ncbi:serine/threonine-protein kinase [Oxynema aestuarii]|jgi:serine/threonine protein kinase|uniref:non-specific serine/threonine protein kinase n=1 Tax=Oxynema aestuarii AP17 TaxID=2064643 RepID=A0A6H1U1P6_9CYAN|nr:serine/threonine-protein kinase [Oxynema aestuarii]QIZ72575.1 protein kinase [Oxynema aestuarii AP17]